MGIKKIFKKLWFIRDLIIASLLMFLFNNFCYSIPRSLMDLEFYKSQINEFVEYYPLTETLWHFLVFSSLSPFITDIIVILHIGLFVLFAILVKSNQFAYIKGLLGF